MSDMSLHRPAPTTAEGAPLLSLNSASVGDVVEILAVDDAHARIQALRFGINPGAQVTVTARVPGGPTVIESAAQEIGVGRPLAEKIEVRYVRTR